MKKIITDEFWNCMKDLFPNNKGKPGRPPISARKAISGIMFVLENGSKWKFLPGFYGKPSTVHGTFMRWVKSGLFIKILERARHYYLSINTDLPTWFAIDSSSCKAPYAKWSGKNPTDRGKRGIKKNIIIDKYGAPLALSVGPANRHDSCFFKETLDNLVAPKTKSVKIMAADSSYDVKKLRKVAANKGFCLYASTNIRRSRNMLKVKPSFRWKVEASHSWLNNFRSLKTCWTKTKETFLSFLQLGASVLLFRKVIIFG